MNNRGFSLVELVIVIVILGLMLTLLSPVYTKFIFKSQASTDVHNMQEIKTAVEVFYAENGVDGTDEFILEQSDDNIIITSSDKDEILESAGYGSEISLKSSRWQNVYMKYTPSSNEWIIEGTNSLDEELYDLSTMAQ